jgi:LysR family glycine cleavage system transcriptional activator
MVYRHYRLPSLTSLAAFEASARHRSVQRAASELNVTPGAVSRQIKALEEELGVPLFERTLGGLMLTADAEALYAVLSQSFSRTAETVQAIRSRNRTKRVTLACTHAFASQWLMRRIGEFWRRFPDISVDHLISDDAREFRRAEVDLRIRYGFGAWPDETSALLMTDTIYPIAGPEFARQHAACVATDIPDLPLLHVDWADGEPLMRRMRGRRVLSSGRPGA